MVQRTPTSAEGALPMNALHMLRMSVFRKVFLGFLAVLLLLSAVCAGAVWAAGHALADQTQQTTHSKLQFFMDYLQEELRNVNQMLVALNNDPDLPTASLYRNDVFDYEFVELSAEIRSKMNIVHYSSEYVTDVFLLLPQSGLRLSVNNGVVPLAVEDRQMLQRHLNRSDEMVRLIDDETITYSAAVTDASKTEALYVLGATLSQQKIIGAMKRFNEDNAYQVFLIDEQSQKRIGIGGTPELDFAVYAQLSANPTDRITLDGVSYLVQRANDRNFTLVSYVAERDVLAPVVQIWRWFGWLALALVVFSLTYSIFVYNQIHKPLRQLVQTMREVEIGNLNVGLPVGKEDEFGLVYRQFNKMVVQLKSLVEEVLESKIQRQQAELKQLQSQINPHFLFNCFYIGYRLAKSGEMDNVAKLCKYLGDYFRFVTQQGSRDVPLKEEFKYIVTYLEIQKMRFSNRLEYEIEMEPGVEEITVPGLLLQPLVENALLHGIERVDRQGTLRIHAFEENGILRLTVRDNGNGMEAEAWEQLQRRLQIPSNDTDHFGLWNVHWRLRHRYGEEAGLTLRNREPEGFQAQLELPVRPPAPGGENIAREAI